MSLVRDVTDMRTCYANLEVTVRKLQECVTNFSFNDEFFKLDDNGRECFRRRLVDEKFQLDNSSTTTTFLDGM